MKEYHMSSIPNYILEDVTSRQDLWHRGDPVRPELNADFKTKKGRYVFGLLNDNGSYDAFVCCALTVDVPIDIMGLSRLTNVLGRVAVPYTVWSHQRGAGKTIIKKLINFVRENDLADRVVTLSPKTEMARRFHLKNSALVFRDNVATVNFEYKL